MSCTIPKLVHAVWCCNRLEMLMCHERYLCFQYLGIRASLVCFCFVSRWFNSGSSAAHSLTQTVLRKTEGWKITQLYSPKPEHNQRQHIRCVLPNAATAIQHLKFSQSWDIFFFLADLNTTSSDFKTRSYLDTARRPGKDLQSKCFKGPYPAHMSGGSRNHLLKLEERLLSSFSQDVSTSNFISYGAFWSPSRGYYIWENRTHTVLQICLCFLVSNHTLTWDTDTNCKKRFALNAPSDQTLRDCTRLLLKQVFSSR